MNEPETCDYNCAYDGDDNYCEDSYDVARVEDIIGKYFLSIFIFYFFAIWMLIMLIILLTAVFGY